MGEEKETLRSKIYETLGKGVDFLSVDPKLLDFENFGDLEMIEKLKRVDFFLEDQEEEYTPMLLETKEKQEEIKVEEVKFALKNITSSPEKISVGSRDVKLILKILNYGSKTAELVEVKMRSNAVKPSVTDSHHAFIDKIKPKDFKNASFLVDITAKEGITPIEFEIKHIENGIEKKLIKKLEIPIMPKKKSKILALFTLLIIIVLFLSLFLVANYYLLS